MEETTESKNNKNYQALNNDLKEEIIKLNSKNLDCVREFNALKKAYNDVQGIEESRDNDFDRKMSELNQAIENVNKSSDNSGSENNAKVIEGLRSEIKSLHTKNNTLNATCRKLSHELIIAREKSSR